MGDYLKINEGDEVRSLGKLLSVPVGDAVGRVVDPLGNPLDGMGPINASEDRFVETLGMLGVAERQPVHEPLQTGLKAIDAMTPDWSRPAGIDYWRPQDR
ncbi:MAG: hypothetical protein R3C28_06435 [Pirellulaceae bacterium]